LDKQHSIWPKAKKTVQMKKSILPLLAVTLVLASCSSAYKAGQTPDDVYYSHGPTPVAAKEEVAKEDNDVYKSYWQDADDSYLRMKVQDRNRWGTIDDVDYWYGYNNAYSTFNSNWYGYKGWNVSLGWNSWNRWTNPFYFNSFYNSWNNPYCWNQPVIIVNKFPTRETRPAINNQGYRNYGFDRGGNSIFSSPKSGTNNRPSNSDLFRSIFRTPSGSSSNGSSNSSSGSTWERATRSLNSGSSSSPSSSGSSSSGSSGGGSSRSSGSSGGGRRGG
jgi:hypothetical protein